MEDAHNSSIASLPSLTSKKNGRRQVGLAFPNQNLAEKVRAEMEVAQSHGNLSSMLDGGSAALLGRSLLKKKRSIGSLRN